MGKDPADDRINVHWMTIKKGVVRFADVQTVMIPYDPKESYDDHYVAMAPTRMEDLKVLARYTSDDLSSVNDFVSAAVNVQFEFNLSGGWIKKYKIMSSKRTYNPYLAYIQNYFLFFIFRRTY